MKKIFSVFQIQFLTLSLRLAVSIWTLNFCIVQIIFFIQDKIDLSVAEQVAFPPLNARLLDVLIIGPIVEELIFRKCIIDFTQPRYNRIFACILSAIIFAVAHMFDFTNFSIIKIGFLNFVEQGITGFIYAIIYVRTQRIAYAMLAHIFFNMIVLIPKSIIYIKNDALSYYPHLLIGIAAAIYLAFEVKQTFVVQQATL